jgi:hypothetical protein
VLRYGAADEAERKLIETLGRRRVWRFVAGFVKRVMRRPGEISVKAFAGEP